MLIKIKINLPVDKSRFIDGSYKEIAKILVDKLSQNEINKLIKMLEKDSINL